MIIWIFRNQAKNNRHYAAMNDLEELVKNVDASNKTELDRATKIAD